VNELSRLHDVKCEPRLPVTKETSWEVWRYQIALFKMADIRYFWIYNRT